MPIVFGGVLISFLVLFGVLGLIALHRASLPLVRGLFGGWAEQRGFRRWFLRAIGLDALANAIAWVVHRVRQAVANAAAANLDAVTLWLRGLTGVAHYTYKELGDGWDHVADSIGALVHHTVPTLIHKITAPIDARARAALHTAYRSISLIRELDHRMARLLHGIDRLLRDTVIPRIRSTERSLGHVITRDIPALRRREAALEREVYGDLRARLGRIEKALGLGVLAAVVYKVLARVAPWLFCRNVNKVGRAVCGLNPETLNSLLALALGTLVITDLRSLVQAAEAIEGEITGEIKNILNA